MTKEITLHTHRIYEKKKYIDCLSSIMTAYRCTREKNWEGITSGLTSVFNDVTLFYVHLLWFGDGDGGNI